jgi:hypothetical protein
VAYAEIHRDHPFHPSPDFVSALRELIDKPGSDRSSDLDSQEDEP